MCLISNFQTCVMWERAVFSRKRDKEREENSNFAQRINIFSKNEQNQTFCKARTWGWTLYLMENFIERHFIIFLIK